MQCRPGHNLWQPTVPAANYITRSQSTPIAHTTWLRGGGADGPSSPFSVLRLAEDNLLNAGGAVHRRQYGGLLVEGTSEPPDWTELFEDPTRPLIVDVGCGAGRFVLLAAWLGKVPHIVCGGSTAPVHALAGQPCNALGLEQHAQLVSRANHWASAQGLAGRCAFVAANVKPSLTAVLASYPGPIAVLAIQYPDPHYREDRHVVTPSLVADCAQLLSEGSLLLLASDVHATACHMTQMFTAHARAQFQLHPLHGKQEAVFEHDGRDDIDPYISKLRAGPVQPAVAEAGTAVLEGGERWLMHNPLGLATEREVFAQEITHRSVYRTLLTRTSG